MLIINGFYNTVITDLNFTVMEIFNAAQYYNQILQPPAKYLHVAICSSKICPNLCIVHLSKVLISKMNPHNRLNKLYFSMVVRILTFTGAHWHS